MTYNFSVQECLNPFKHESPAETVRGFLSLAVYLLLFLFFVRTFVCQTMAVSSASMKNNLMVGDHVLVNMVHSRNGRNAIERLLMPPRTLCRGMVVAFHPPGPGNRVFVKRIIGLPGEEIRIQGGQVRVNGIRLKETYLAASGSPGRTGNSIYCRVPEDHYYCLGDNRTVSNDSRFWGPLPRENIVGIPWRIYWSFQSRAETYDCSGFFASMQRFVSYVTGFLYKTRWQRTYRRIQPNGVIPALPSE